MQCPPTRPGLKSKKFHLVLAALRTWFVSIFNFEKIIVFPNNIRSNLEMTGGLILSERVAGALVKKGMGRQEAHELIRKSSMTAYSENISFRDALLRTPQVSSKLLSHEIDSLLTPETYLGSSFELIEGAVEATKKELT